MAYASTITVTPAPNGPRAGWVLTISETDAAATSETEIVLAAEGLPPVGRVYSQLCIPTAGAATTVDPVLGEVTDPATGAWRIENETAAALVHNAVSAGVRYSGITSMFHRSKVDTGTNSSVTSRYYIAAGWTD